MANDLLVGNKHIPKMYFGIKGVLQVYFGNKLIWPNNQKKLHAGSQNVCIEFVVPNGPNDNDIQLSNLAIFTHDIVSSNSINFVIYHESGLIIYKENTDSIDHTVSPKYELEGDLRKVQSIQNVTLKKGFKYYIQYTNQNNTFKPAYFENIAGNSINYSNNNVYQNVANINSAKKYLGVVNNLLNWFNASEDDLMICNFQADGMTQGSAYIRNSTCNGATIIGENNKEFPTAEKDKFLKLAANSSFMYIGNNYQENYSTILEANKLYTKNNTLDNTKYKGIKASLAVILSELNIGEYALMTDANKTDHIYKKKNNIQIDYTYNVSGDNNNIITRDIIKLSYNANANANKYVAVNGYWWYADKTGYIYQLKSTYTIDFGSDDSGYNPGDITSTSDLVQNCLYYMNTGNNCPALGGQYVHPGVNYWDGTSFTVLSNNNYESYFTISSISDAFEELHFSGSVNLIGGLSQLSKTSYSESYIISDIRSQQINPNTKYYLEINGEEK